MSINNIRGIFRELVRIRKDPQSAYDSVLFHLLMCPNSIESCEEKNNTQSHQTNKSRAGSNR
jgi:hypothetical protein